MQSYSLVLTLSFGKETNKTKQKVIWPKPDQLDHLQPCRNYVPYNLPHSYV